MNRVGALVTPNDITYLIIEMISFNWLKWMILRHSSCVNLCTLF